MTKPETGNPPDWEKIEAEYRAGTLSVRQIATLNGVSHTAINKRARGATPPWTRNLAGKVREAVASGLVAAVSTARTESRAVQQAAQVAVDILITHRRDTGRLRKQRDDLLEAIATERRRKGTKERPAMTIAEWAAILERVSRIEVRIQALERNAWGLAGLFGGTDEPADTEGGGAADESESPVTTYRVELPDNGR